MCDLAVFCLLCCNNSWFYFPKLKLEEESLQDELSQLQKKEQAAKEAVAKQEKEKERIAAEEERYWREYTRYRRDLLLAEDQYRRSVFLCYPSRICANNLME